MSSFAAAAECAAATPLQLSVWQAAVLGLTQGLSEFLPISSSGHLILVPWAADWRNIYCAKEANKFFDVALHLGTFVGAAFYLRRDVVTLLRAWFASLRARSVQTVEQRLAWLLVLSALPAAAVGALFEEVLAERFGHPWQIAVFLAVFGVVLYVVDRLAPTHVGYRDLGARQVLAMSIGQAAALMPGVSRSGVTITAARATGVDRDAAARFSFLMSLPVTLGAALYSARHLGGPDSGLTGSELQFLVGIVVSGISGAFAVYGVLRIVRHYSYAGFAVYRLLVALGVLALAASGARSATI